MNLFKKWWRKRIPKTILPVFNMNGFINTIEGCLLHGKVPNSVYQSVRDAFRALPDNVQDPMFFSSKRGEWAARARWWRELVYNALPQKQAADVMQRFCKWYRHCIDIDKKAKGGGIKPSIALLEACSQSPEGEKWLELYYSSEEKFQQFMNLISKATPEQAHEIICIIELEQEQRKAPTVTA